MNIQRILTQVPSFTGFCSVAELARMAEELSARRDRFDVRVVGHSEAGEPIHHIRAGSGDVKALFVGWPHPNEPVGGLTVKGLVSLLGRDDSELLGSGVEWHIVPCIDPDGAKLNEGWALKPFDIGSFLRESFRQEPMDQVERSFPVHHKKYHFDKPSQEARVLQGVLSEVKPDFYFSLHNSRMGGASCYLTRDIGKESYSRLHALMDDFGVPRHRGGSPLEGGLANYAEGIWELFTVRRYYDYLETVSAHPELGLHDAGACSWEHLMEVKPDSVSLVFEMPYLTHPMSGSTREIGGSLRREKLRIDADNKFIITCILEEWDRLEAQLDPTSPFHRKILHSIVRVRSRLAEGLPSWESRIDDLLSNPRYSRSMTEADVFHVAMHDRFYALCNSHEIVRLLEASPQTAEVKSALARLRPLFTEGLEDLDRRLDFSRFRMIPHDVLGRVQLGAGLIVLDSVIQKKNA